MIPTSARLPLGCILLTFAFGLISAGIHGELDEIQAQIEIATQEINGDRERIADLAAGDVSEGAELAPDETGAQ